MSSHMDHGCCFHPWGWHFTPVALQPRQQLRRCTQWLKLHAWHVLYKRLYVMKLERAATTALTEDKALEASVEDETQSLLGDWHSTSFFQFCAANQRLFAKASQSQATVKAAWTQSKNGTHLHLLFQLSIYAPADCTSEKRWAPSRCHQSNSQAT